MRVIFLLFLILMQVGCANKTPTALELSGRAVRMTVYWGEDKWSKAGQSSSGAKLRCGVSAAVDPKVFPYGTKLFLKEAGIFVVCVDTGSAVKSRKAAKRMGRNCPVVDVFFSSKGKAMKFVKQNPYFVTACKIQ